MMWLRELLLSGLLVGTARAEDVLMVIGGQFFNATSRHHEPLSSVEVVGPTRTCEVAGLPEPLYGMSAVRLEDGVLVCGGFHFYYRWQCYMYSAHNRRWQLARSRLPTPAGFPAAASAGGEVFSAGGREYRSGDGRGRNDWNYETMLLTLQADRWIQMVPLPERLADSCLVVSTHDGRQRLWLLGGSSLPQRYKAEVYAIDLDNLEANWTRMPDLPDPRMWSACTVTTVEDELGILVAGGYYNGVSSMWLPLADRYGNSLERFGPNGDKPKWEWLSSLTMARKWGPALGYLGKNLAMAGGGDYGDNTIDILVGRDWIRSKVVMRHKREFTAGVTVPSQWFPECSF